MKTKINILKSIILGAVLLILFQLLTSCEEAEMPEPTPKAREYIIFKSTGLNMEPYKQIHIRAGGYLLDTVIQGNFTHVVEVTQKNMTCYMEVKTTTPISDALSIEGQGMTVRRANSCDWYKYDITYTFIY